MWKFLPILYALREGHLPPMPRPPPKHTHTSPASASARNHYMKVTSPVTARDIAITSTTWRRWWANLTLKTPTTPPYDVTPALVIGIFDSGSPSRRTMSCATDDYILNIFLFCQKLFLWEFYLTLCWHFSFQFMLPVGTNVNTCGYINSYSIVLCTYEWY